MEEALKVIGKTEEYLRDKSKQPQKKLIERFFKWVDKIKNKDMLCHNPQFDYGFLKIKTDKYNLKFPFPYKCFDLHTLAAVKYFEVNKKFLIEDGKSAVNSAMIFEFCGLKDERIQLKEGKVVKEGKPHNGLEDAKLEAECFFRLVYGKAFLDEFKKFPVPAYLSK
jgi:DNA polymerase III epsilon subunit-like protein